MKKKFFVFGVSLNLSLLLLSSMGVARGRNEIDRYSLLRDRAIIDREIKHGLYSGRYSHFFDLDILLASGTREMINDISNGVENASSSSEETLNVLNVLNKNMNSEKFVDLNASLGIPLPYFKLWGVEFLPSLFASQSFGIMSSVDNQSDATNPKAQIYFKTDTKYGVSTGLKWNDEEEYRVAIYKFIRSDIFVQRTSAQIADQGELADFDELSEEDEAYGADLSYSKTNGDSNYLFEVLELFPSKVLKSNTNSAYGMKPIFHTRYSRKINNGIWQWRPFFGAHYSQRYSLIDALYLGSRVKLNHHLPFSFTFKLSNQFLGFMPTFETKYFHLSYAFKTPYINPQDDIWVSAHHSLNLRFPFP